MANDTPAPAGSLRVTVCHACPDGAWQRAVTLPAGATVADAVAASGFAAAHPGQDPWAHGVGVFGKAQAADAPLADGDRVEIYRGLSFDPKESRRRRAEHRRALAARGGKARPAGLL
ncbi:RnfH family protein [Bordetella bronchiseptica]|uniref:RnfH family protein n=1 Tax=Bordetella bronchiseptica TaxID=518 RepID=UPI00028B3BBD|nr:RnfH family protein [Bordetella bronchiseptica]KCV30798.1 RnfH family ubiquitin [Bordetella bronchiseptica 00-P-2730]KDD64193.1 RnfH family ubiquitin [Bordetella bronchiseptica OSU553]AUL15708.1 RnfH family protein [Bordetella bronchiseptica]AWP58809.1 RnfH family protein [Bordetella bronchiseptica]AWQ05555.1 RnfH family protein [Bordetella bronchiseptica]